MHLFSVFSTLAVAAAASTSLGDLSLPLLVPHCPKTATAEFNESVPDKKPFPLTQIEMCWKDTSLHLGFKAFNETNFYFDESQGTNDDIWEYEVMEVFIHRGESDPQMYLEFEVNPNNVTYQAFIYNPTKVRAEDAPFDHFFVSDPAADGFSASTTLDREAETWFSDVVIPLGLFNVDKTRGTRWRMNFFRTVTSPETFPEQELGGWKIPDEANFHITSKFGDIVLA